MPATTTNSVATSHGGEVEGRNDENGPRVTFTNENYKWGNGGSSAEGAYFTKYMPSGQTTYWGGSGEPDNKTELEIADDAAHANWGGTWRMPTKSEFEELLDNEKIEVASETVNGIAGWRFTSKVSGYAGNSIFLPGAGWYGSSASNDANACYWSSMTTGVSSQWCAWMLYLQSAGSNRVTQEGRARGLTVRAVCP